MAISYKPLWKLLVDKNMNKGDLKSLLGVSSATIAKLGKDEHVSMETIERICIVLGCGIADVVEVAHSDIEVGE